MPQAIMQDTVNIWVIFQYLQDTYWKPLKQGCEAGCILFMQSYSAVRHICTGLA